MRIIFGLALLCVLVGGCATSSLEDRRAERSAAYAALSPEWRGMVDMHQIAVGMPMDAVYIAWGKPSQVFNGQSERGNTVTWVYTGTKWEEYRYWNYQRYGADHFGYTQGPTLDYETVPITYAAAEVVFENGAVKSWRDLKPPQRR